MIKLALIGAGSMAKNYINTLATRKDAKITAILAKTEKNLKKISASKLRTTKIKDIFSRKFDGIIIATDASSHYLLIQKFLKRGFNILVEKPLTTNLKDALKIKKIKTNSRLMVGHTMLFHPAYIALKKIVQNKKILSISFKGYNNNARNDTSLLWDWGPHPISIFLDLIGSKPYEIKINKAQGDEISLDLNFQNGTKGLINVGWNSSLKIRLLEVKTEQELIVLDDMKQHKLKITKSNNTNYPKTEDFQPLNREISEFIRLIEGKKISSDLDFGIEVTRVLQNCEELIKQKKIK